LPLTVRSGLAEGPRTPKLGAPHRSRPARSANGGGIVSFTLDERWSTGIFEDSAGKQVTLQFLGWAIEVQEPGGAGLIHDLVPVFLVNQKEPATPSYLVDAYGLTLQTLDR
jgi:hypothetical protein